MSGTTVALHIPAGETLLGALLSHGAGLAHDCGGVQACASCRVIVRDGLDRLSPANDDEQDLLDRAFAQPDSRLACQAVSAGGEFAIELPAAGGAPSRRGSRAPGGQVSFSEAAARHLAEQLARNPRCTAIKVSVKPAGCSGLAYRIELAEGQQDADEIYESAGIVIVVDAQSLPHVQGTRIDLVPEGLGTRLEFDNPNAIGACGCGKSFRTG